MFFFLRVWVVVVLFFFFFFFLNFLQHLCEVVSQRGDSWFTIGSMKTKRWIIWMSTHEALKFRKAEGRGLSTALASPGSLPCLRTEPLRSGQIVSMAGSKLAWHLMGNKLEALEKKQKKHYSLFLRKQISVISLNRAPLYDVETLTDSSYTGHSDWPYHPFQFPLEIGSFSVTCAKWLFAPKRSTD